MAYHGLIPILQKHLISIKDKVAQPAVLEIGVDKGITLIPIVVALASVHNSYMYIGVDINIQESVKLIVNYLGSAVAPHTFLIEENSLNFLPKLIQQNMKFDLILIDGDHNYHTVSQELNYVKDLIKSDGIIVVDDYEGRWESRDLFYAERPGYENNEFATKRINTEKQGVKIAVDEWVQQNPEWNLSKPVSGEPVILMKGKF